MGTRPTMDWPDLEEFAELFFIFADREREVRWFRFAWERLAERGLTAYDDETARHRQIVRMLALGSFYRTIAECAWDHSSDLEWLFSSELTGIPEEILSPVRLGAMAGLDALSPDSTNSETFGEAVQSLVDEELPSLHADLVEAFGTPTRLFVSLWCITDDSIAIGEPSSGDVELIVNTDLTPETHRAFAWVTDLDH